MKGDIILDEKFGLNPSMVICWYCREAKEIILHGKLNKSQKEMYDKEDGEAPREVCFGWQHPCEECKKIHEGGVLVIECEEEKENAKEVEVTGKWAVIKKSSINIDSPITFVTKKTAEELKLFANEKG